ncbi:MAG TPA: hypothetical protein VJT71_12995 [Pyrinomonadaceae bacterium]|nr:hypothetical protein [Pyrinomonadaceae bacterium]
MSRMRIACVTACLVLLTASTQGKVASQTTSSKEAKLREAEQVAAHFVKRFSATLDFGVVYREMFVRERVLRRRNVVSMFDGLIEDSLLKKLHDREKEQAYIAFMNTFYVSWLYLLNVNGLYDKDDPAVYLPRDIQAEIKRTAFNRCRFLDRDDDDCENLRFKTRKGLARFISFSNRLTVLFRRHMPGRPFDSPAYRANVRNIVWNGQGPYVNNGDSFLEIDKSRPVYEIASGMFLFSIIEEEGTLRIASLTISN